MYHRIEKEIFYFIEVAFFFENEADVSGFRFFSNLFVIISSMKYISTLIWCKIYSENKHL